jgi:hypothetical protein
MMARMRRFPAMDAASFYCYPVWFIRIHPQKL